MIDNLPETKKLTDMQLLLIEHIKNGMTWNEGAREAGYSESSSKNIKALMLRSQAFCDRLQKECRNEYLSIVPKVLRARTKAIEGAFDDNGDLVTERYDKLEKTMEAIEKHSGVAKQDIILNKPNFNLFATNARDMMRQLNNPEQVQDAEVVNE